MRILVIGGGGREHAMVWKLAQSSLVEAIWCAPGNPGIAQWATCVSIPVSDHAALAQFALDQHIDLTVVGPEAPLVNGIVDYFTGKGLKIFGPSQAAAQLEGSKAFAKELLIKHNIPTAGYAVFDDAAAAKEYIDKQGAPLVVKADGLAAGKGVVVAFTNEEARQAVDLMLGGHAFGEAGATVVIEEWLDGEEVSVLAFTDGYTVRPMVAAQDHKRVYDQDQGPNTGGMGAYAPAPVLTAELRDTVMQTILQPAVDAMRLDGRLYKGCLYAGLMITAEGPKVIEFNARFGDPETQVILPLLQSDLAAVMMACVDEKLDEIAVEWSDGAAVCVVMAAGGYPGQYTTGNVIKGLEETSGQATIFHAGTGLEAGTIVATGGRVLGVTAVGKTLPQAVDEVYRKVAGIAFDGCHYRRDIAYRALRR